MDDGRAAVVRNGHHPEREIQTGIGSVAVKVPKLRARDGEPVTFRSALVPSYVRKTQSLEASLPWLYLKGILSGEMEAALEALVGSQAKGLSASTVSRRLKQAWAKEYQDWRRSRLDQDDWVYAWADGVYSGLKAEGSKLCALVVIGVKSRCDKRFPAIDDGAMGLWAALEEVFSRTRQQCCWMHKTGNVLNGLPKSVQPKAKQALHDIWQVEIKHHTEKAFDLFVDTYEPKYPKTVLCSQKGREELMAFYDFPAQHWQSLRTTNAIESTFGTRRHRTKRSKKCLTREGTLHMMYKLAMCVQKIGVANVALTTWVQVMTGVKFKDGRR